MQEIEWKKQPIILGLDFCLGNKIKLDVQKRCFKKIKANDNTKEL